MKRWYTLSPVTANPTHFGPLIEILRGADWSVGESRVEVLREGTFHANVGRGKPARSVTFSADDLRKMVEVYAQAQAAGMFPGGGGKVDVNHALALGSADSKDTAARARVLRLETGPHIDKDTGKPDGTLGLFAITAWTAGGSTEVNSGSFAGVSSELTKPGAGFDPTTGEAFDGWLFTGYTLCNDPFIPGLADVTAPKLAARSGTVVTLSTRERTPAPAPEIRTMKTLLSKLGLDAEANEAAALRALEAKDVAYNEVLSQRDALRSERDELVVDRTEALRVELVEGGHCEPAKLDTAMTVFSNAAGTWAERKAFLFSVFPANEVKNIEPKAAPAGEEPPTDEPAKGVKAQLDAKFDELLAAERDRTGRVSPGRRWELLQEAEAFVFSSQAAQASYLNNPAAEA